MVDRIVKSDYLSETHWSLSEYAAEAKRRVLPATLNEQGQRHFHTFAAASWDEANEMAETGWQDALPEAMAISEGIVETVNREHNVEAFHAVWDVSGGAVDVGRYLSGEPECMIEMPPQEISKVGSVVTLVKSMSASAAYGADELKAYGHMVVALALALSRLGHSVEIWVDCPVTGSRTGGSRRGTGLRAYTRVLVKGANDALDPAQIMFALAHPALLRQLTFAVYDGFPSPFKAAFASSRGRGTPKERNADERALYPEGTIFLPTMSSDRGNPAEFAEKHLRGLGLLAE